MGGIVGEVYYCFDDGKIVTKENDGEHSSNHTHGKFTITKGWPSETPAGQTVILHKWMTNQTNQPVARGDVVKFIKGHWPEANAEERLRQALRHGDIFESKPGFFRSVQV